MDHDKLLADSRRIVRDLEEAYVDVVVGSTGPPPDVIDVKAVDHRAYAHVAQTMVGMLESWSDQDHYEGLLWW